jgi:hypothetical protein
MTEQSPQEKLNGKMNSIRYKVQKLQSDVRLSSLIDQMEDLDSDIGKIRQRVQDLRTREYVFGKGLETRAYEYARRWAQMHPNIRKQIEAQSPALQLELSMLLTTLGQLEANAAKPVIGSSDGGAF